MAEAAARHAGPYTVVVVDGDPGSAPLRESIARLAAAGSAAGIHLLCLAEAPAGVRGLARRGDVRDGVRGFARLP